MTAPEGKALLRTQLQLQCAFANGRQDSLLLSGLRVRPPCRWKPKAKNPMGSGDRVPADSMANTLKNTGKKRVGFPAELQCYALAVGCRKIDLTAIK